MKSSVLAPFAPPGQMPVALVTGASSGLGACYAARLAELGGRLILTARREDRLQELSARLAAKHGTQPRVVPADLSTPDGLKHVLEAIAREGWSPDILINNAGFGHYGAITSQPPESITRMCALNVTACAELARACAEPMVSRRRGLIVNIASVAAYAPVPLFGVYSATKAFLLSFSQALSAELEEAGVRVLCVSPGPTATEFQAVAAGQAPSVKGELASGSPEAVVEATFAALSGRKWTLVPSFRARIQAWLMSVVPRKVFARTAFNVMKKQRLAAQRHAP